MKEKVIVYLEYYDPNDFLKLANGNVELIFIALTPIACYQLDNYNQLYKIPDDFCGISEIGIPKNTPPSMFEMYHLEEVRTKLYWLSLLDHVGWEYGAVNSLYYGDKLK